MQITHFGGLGPPHGESDGELLGQLLGMLLNGSQGEALGLASGESHFGSCGDTFLVVALWSTGTVACTITCGGTWQFAHTIAWGPQTVKLGEGAHSLCPAAFPQGSAARCFECFDLCEALTSSALIFQERECEHILMEK